MMPTSLEKIEAWLKERGYSTSFGSGFAWCVSPTNRLVMGDPSIFKYKTSMIAVLLHECGHVDQFTDPTYETYSLPRVRKDKKPKDSFYISVLEMEIDAWNRAKQIAQHLGIKGLESAFRRTKYRRLMSYVRWASMKGDFSFLKDE